MIIQIIVITLGSLIELIVLNNHEEWSLSLWTVRNNFTIYLIDQRSQKHTSHVKFNVCN